MDTTYIPMTRYSKKNHSFYPFGLQYKELPDDIVVIPESEFKRAMTRKPGETFEVVDGLVVIIPAPIPTFEQKVSVKLDDIRRRSQVARNGGVKVLIDNKEIWIFSDDSARLQLMMFLNSGITTEYPIESHDNKSLLLNVDIAKELMSKINQHDQAVLIIAEQHRQNMLKSEDPAKYDINTAWPKSYYESIREIKE